MSVTVSVDPIQIHKKIHTDEIKELRKKLDEGVFMIKRDNQDQGPHRKNKDRP